MSPARDASAELSVPSISTIVECEIKRPLWAASADFASGVRRLFASETPCETESQPATAQTISEHEERAERSADPQAPAAALRLRRARAAVVGGPPPLPSSEVRTRAGRTVGTLPFARPPRYTR